MKMLSILLSLFVSVSVMAAESSESAFNSTDHSIHAAVGFTGGGLSLGGEYEYRKERTFGVGGYLRLLSKDDDRPANGVKAVGAFVRPHFHRRAWDFHVTAGFGIHAVDGANNADDETALGAAFGTGLYYQYSKKVALGAEQFTLYGWLADDYRGLIDQHTMFKVRWQM